MWTIKHSTTSKNTKLHFEYVIENDIDRYKQEDYMGLISQVYISHLDYGHMGRTCILKRAINIMFNVGTLYLLIGYLWTNWNYEEITKHVIDFWKSLSWSGGLTFGTWNHYLAQLCWTGYQPAVIVNVKWMQP